MARTKVPWARSLQCIVLIAAWHPDDAAVKSGAILSFSGDAEDGGDVAVDLFAEASRAVAAADAEEDPDAEGEDDDDGAEPEDDFNAAWEVLDLARAIYEKQKDEDDEVGLKLADTYIALGDVSLETGEFYPRPLAELGHSLRRRVQRNLSRRSATFLRGCRSKST